MPALPNRALLYALGIACAMVAVSCGGTGGEAAAGPDAMDTGGSAPSPGSSGAITAFGSVFVNGHRFSTDLAVVIDDDTGHVTRSTAGLDVGMVVDVKPSPLSTRERPVADELHLHPLARGFVDAFDAAAGTIRVMGQSVQLTSATLFNDRRRCVEAATEAAPCTAITGPSALPVTTGSGVSVVPGAYVTVHGDLYAAASSTGAAHIVATLVSVSDTPHGAGLAAFKAEGVVVAAAGRRFTLGGLDVDLTDTHCYAAGGRTPCASAFGAGQVVSVFAATSPSLPAHGFAPTAVRARSTLPVETPGAAIELEGRVSGVTRSPAGFVLRGAAVDARALPAGTALPAVGDRVRVVGTVAGTGNSVVAAALTVLRAARGARDGF